MQVTCAMSIALAAVLLTGCGAVVSLDPLATEREQVFDSGLAGAWREHDGEDTWTIRQSGERAYELIASEDAKPEAEPAKFEMRLVRLSGFLFLDVYPHKSAIRNDLLIPGHIFAKIDRDGDVLHVALVGSDWLRERLVEEQQFAFKRLANGDLALTGPTEELQRLVLQYATEPRAFGDPVELHRQ